ncbi:MAG TPA: DUF4367 domain-containing protein [Candidatus Baltobacteraceae bacterium]|jgi:outer membrane lipoprotein-sorting protein|nr:DUF4367 domain-containing protein [Candidatus Baltobacteraceae bacterium]
MFRAKAALAAFALALVAPVSAMAASPSPSELLREAMSAPDNVSYVGEVQTLRFGAQKSEAAIYRIEHRAPDLTRRWYLAPQDLYGDSIISRGETSYSIDVTRSRVVVTQDDAIDDQVAEDDNFALLAANYQAMYGPDEHIDGRLVHVVLLNNKHTGQTTMRVRIDAATKLVVEKEQYGSKGSLVAQTRFQRLRYTSGIPAAVFDVPKSMPRVNGPSRAIPSNDLHGLIKTAGFAAQGPKYLPEGFTPVEGDVADIKGVRSLHLLYSDGIRTISLFQNAKGAAVDMSRYHPNDTRVQDTDAKYVQEGPTTLLAWSEAGLHLALVGDLELHELEKIAASVVP